MDRNSSQLVYDVYGLAEVPPCPLLHISITRRQLGNNVGGSQNPMNRYAICDHCGAQDAWTINDNPILVGGATLLLREDDGSELEHTLELCEDCKELLLKKLPGLAKALDYGPPDMGEPQPKGVINNPGLFSELVTDWPEDEVGKCFVCGRVKPCVRNESLLLCMQCFYNCGRCDVCGQQVIPGKTGILVRYERYHIGFLCHEHMDMADPDE